MAAKERTLGIRLGDLTKALEEFEASTGVGGATLGKECLRSALDYFKKHGEFTFPACVIPRSRLSALIAGAADLPKSQFRAAEEGAPYRTKKA